LTLPYFEKITLVFQSNRFNSRKKKEKRRPSLFLFHLSTP
jgi:hypothetical protein